MKGYGLWESKSVPQDCKRVFRESFKGKFCIRKFYIGKRLNNCSSKMQLKESIKRCR